MQNGFVIELRFGCSATQKPRPERQVLVGKESCFIQEASILGRSQAQVQEQTPSCGSGIKSFQRGGTRGGRGLHAEERGQLRQSS